MTTVLVVVPCSAEKSKIPCAVEQMYLGQLHLLAMAAARSLVRDRSIRVLSGKHGLLRLDAEIWPYDQRIDKPGHVETSALVSQLLTVLGDDDQLLIVSLCPKSYTSALRSAAERLSVSLLAPLDGAAGIGVIRRRLANIIRGGWEQLPVEQGASQ